MSTSNCEALVQCGGTKDLHSSLRLTLYFARSGDADAKTSFQSRAHADTRREEKKIIKKKIV